MGGMEAIRNKTDITIHPARWARRAVMRFSRWSAMSRALGACLPVILLPLTVSSQPAPDLGTDEQREAGRLLYMDKCAQCHWRNR